MWLMCLLLGLSVIEVRVCVCYACLRLQMLNIISGYLYQFYYENSNEIDANTGLKGIP